MGVRHDLKGGRGKGKKRGGMRHKGVTGWARRRLGLRWLIARFFLLGCGGWGYGLEEWEGEEEE
ncbi:uncharacterized protein G2W53_044716 [Senna tora]|uniref:Uncharacterized protein n=1 Tax=Senna tora TaxID=362788 RepID=A0A834SNB4_9FABA|nr:uncharacterized protein G2W53_044716 [Senna tora]